jgi:3-oxoadipate enol-lactonase
MADDTRSFTTADGCTLAYRIRRGGSESGRRIALIHSLALDATVWSGVADRLAARADVLTYDCRGHGRSTRAASAFTAELFAHDLAALLDHVNWPSSAVAGCSMGGNVAQAFAGLFPARVSALGLVDTTAWYGADAPEKWRERAEAARTNGLASLIGFQVTRWLGDRFRAEHPDVVASLTSIFVANDLECYAASCAMLGTADSRAYLPGLRMPAAVIVGEEDYATPVAAAQHIHAAIEGSTLAILPGARHLTPVECAGDIATRLDALMDRA